MTDQELVRAAAEKVMGWKLAWRDSVDILLPMSLADKLGRDSPIWNPLADWNDCWMVAEKAALHSLEKEYDRGGYNERWVAECCGAAKDPDPRRAILRAALATVDSNPGHAPGER